MPKVYICDFCGREIDSKEWSVLNIATNRYYHYDCWKKVRGEDSGKKE